MEYVNSVKEDKWSSSDTSDHDDYKKNKNTSSMSSSSSTPKHKFLKEQLSRSTDEVKKDEKSRIMGIECLSEIRNESGRLIKTNDTVYKNVNENVNVEPKHVFEDVNEGLSDDQSPHLRRAFSKDSVNDPSSWRRSAVRIKRKANSYAKGDGLPQKVGGYRRNPKMSLPQDLPVGSDIPERIPSPSPNIRIKKMSLQVPMYTDSSPMSDVSSKSFVDIDTTPEDTDMPSFRSISPNFSPPSKQQKDKKKKGHKKHRSLSTILKPVWESERVASMVEKATDKAKPVMESDVVTYLAEKYDKVNLSIFVFHFREQLTKY